MQIGLFEQQDKKLKRYDGLIKQVKAAGKIAKYLDCKLRVYHRQIESPTAIFNHLEDLETIGVGVCITASEISSHRPLKTSDLEFTFKSRLPHHQLKGEYTAMDCWNTFFELKNAIALLGSVLGHIGGKFSDTNQIGKEFKLSEQVMELNLAVTRLGLAMRNEIPYDIQDRQ